LIVSAIPVETVTVIDVGVITVAVPATAGPTGLVGVKLTVAPGRKFVPANVNVVGEAVGC
jgi:hypothetical protein